MRIGLLHGAAVTATLAGAVLLPSESRAELFDGFFVVGEVGGERDSTHFTQRVLSPEDVVSRTDRSYSDTAAAWGASVGYDWTLFRRVILGVQYSISNSGAGYDGASLISDFSVDDASDPVIDHLVDVRVGWSAALNLRLGYKVSDRFGLYALAGVDTTRLSIYVPDLMLGGHQNVDTFQLGAGVQYGLTDHVFTRLQYTFTNLRDPDFVIPADGHFNFLDHPVNHIHRVMFGIGYGF